MPPEGWEFQWEGKTDCGCKVVVYDAHVSVYHCPLHKAAPDMLALLIESQHGVSYDWQTRRDAVIAKAKGE